MHVLTFPLVLLRRYVRDMLRHSVESVRCPVGVSRHAGSYALLAAAPVSAVERVLLSSRTDRASQRYTKEAVVSHGTTPLTCCHEQRVIDQCLSAG